ncbi:MAG: hypothetical protein ACEY3E_03065 [Candidatus Tisiphia sp.]
MGETLNNNDQVWSIQLPGRAYSKITNEGLESFEEDIKLRKTPLTVECNNNSYWHWRFDIINKVKVLDTSSQEYRDKFLLSKAREGSDLTVKSLIEEYSYPINVRERGHSIVDYYTHDLAMSRWLFKHGYIPHEFNDLQDIVDDTQSVHNSTLLRATNSYIKDLLEQLQASDEQLDQAAVQTITTIENLSNITSKLEYTPFLLSNLPEDRKKDTFHKIPEDHKLNYLQDNKKAMQAIIKKVVDILKNLYIKTDVDGEYDGTYAN